jgi:YaiO family outer membrane protein
VNRTARPALLIALLVAGQAAAQGSGTATGGASALRPTWLTIGHVHEELSTNAPDWRQDQLQLDWELDATTGYTVEASRRERYGTSDTQLSASRRWQMLPNWRVDATLAIASDPAFTPDRNVAFGASRPLDNGFGLLLRADWRSYETGDVSIVSATVEKYFANFRVAGGLSASTLDSSDTAFARVASFGWYPGADRNVAIIVSDGRELESVGIDQLLETDVRGVALTGLQPITDRVGLRWQIGTHRQGELYRRRYAGLAVRLAL